MTRAEAYLHAKWHLDPSSSLATTDMGRKLRDCTPFGAGRLGPHLIQCRWAEAYLRTKWHLDLSSRLATTHAPKSRGLLCPRRFWRGAGSPSNNVAWAEAYLSTKWHLDLFSRLATTDMGRKLENCG